MTQDEIEAVRQGDHERGCEGRQYTCTCGYDDRLSATIDHLLARAEQAERERDEAIEDHKVTMDAFRAVNHELAEANTQLAARDAAIAAAGEKLKKAKGYWLESTSSPTQVGYLMHASVDAALHALRQIKQPEPDRLVSTYGD